MFKLFKITLISFCILTTTVAFGRSTSYFEATLVHMLSNECDRSCRKEIIESEAQELCRPNRSFSLRIQELRSSHRAMGA